MSRLTTASARVSDALNTRFSCRAFLETPVPEADLRFLIETAMRAPSGGNLQPWHMWAVQGEPLQNFVADIRAKMSEKPAGEGSEYYIYPLELKQPYNGRRRDIGERMYQTLGIEREDKLGRLQQMARNFEFFGAPCAMFFAIDKSMQEGQWSDMGMLIQSIMLLARERGLHSCPQEAWAMWSPSVKSFLDIPDNMTFFCALALGYADPDAAINQLQSPRAQVDEVASFVGF
ncbi:nitroreductase [Alphaproteobacteria bacterium]|nr:nitroreductase [Alphaproteobacteria bacterium]